MKITEVKVFVVQAGWRNYVIAKVETDEGVYGIGEGTLETRELAVAEAIRHFGVTLVGQDPYRIDHLWQGMYRWTFWRGGPVLSSAISALDIALWDIKGKALGVPLYQLLGGACRDRVRVYTHVGGKTPEEAGEQAQALVEEGWTALKTVPFLDTNGVIDDWPSIKKGLAHVRAIREAIGEEVDLLLDGHGRMTPPVAIQISLALEEYRPFFLEEPIRPENPKSLSLLRGKVRIPLATGERLFSKWDFREVIEKDLVDFIQPDVTHAGGITEVKKIAAMAETHYINVAPHNPLGPICTAASVHLDFAIPNFGIQEVVRHQAEWIGEVLPSTLVIRKGWAELPTAPGLGVEFNEEMALKYPYQPREHPHFVRPDGAVTEW